MAVVEYHEGDHGHEVTRFTKPGTGQTVLVMSDGCLITQIIYVSMADERTGHTVQGFGFRDGDEARQNLIKSGYEEEDL